MLCITVCIYIHTYTYESIYVCICTYIHICKYSVVFWMRNVSHRLKDLRTWCMLHSWWCCGGEDSGNLREVWPCGRKHITGSRLWKFIALSHFQLILYFSMLCVWWYEHSACFSSSFLPYLPCYYGFYRLELSAKINTSFY